MYFVVKVTSGQENIAANILQSKLSKGEAPIYSIIVIEGLRGYIIVEAQDELACRNFITKERSIKGIIPKPMDPADVEKLIATKSTAQDISRNDIVEFTSGPFKGYKAKVLKVDELKSDITVELMDVVVPIPITTKMNTAKIIQRANAEES
ncbi:MAG: transcription elongation factor Spt5 [Candidatus Marsarchaeota archaeon]|nr:transcription elongation factor Spt5 [Candidatus Marsarchaeota archaeon]